MQLETQSKDSEAVHIQSKIQARDQESLQKTKTVYASLKQTSSVYRLYCKTPKDSIVMANCNPVIPVMDWTEDAELHKRYVEWREGVELECGSSLSGKSNSVKSNYVLRCSPQTTKWL